MRFLYLIQTNQCHIAFRNGRLFHYMRYKTIFTNFCNTKAAGVIHFFYPQHTKPAVYYFFYIIIANSIAQHNEHFIFANNIFSKLNGMACALPFILVNKMTIQVGVCLLYVVLYLFTEITNNKNKLV